MISSTARAGSAQGAPDRSMIPVHQKGGFISGVGTAIFPNPGVEVDFGNPCHGQAVGKRERHPPCHLCLRRADRFASSERHALHNQAPRVGSKADTHKPPHPLAGSKQSGDIADLRFWCHNQSAISQLFLPPVAFASSLSILRSTRSRIWKPLHHRPASSVPSLIRRSILPSQPRCGNRQYHAIQRIQCL